MINEIHMRLKIISQIIYREGKTLNYVQWSDWELSGM